MWECEYGREPFDFRLFMLRLLKKAWVLLLAAVLGALLIGGPYFLVKVTFGPAKEYEAVTDFYIDYAVQETGEMYTYINSHTWNQLMKDDVFTDKILAGMSGILQDKPLQEGAVAALGKEAEISLEEIEQAAGITKKELQGYLYATMLSDTRIVTTTVTTNSPELTMKVNGALIQAMYSFGKEQKEIADVRILQEPTEAELVIADVRTFRACMLGAVIFVFLTALYLLFYYILDDAIYIPSTFERRYGIPMLGTIHSPEIKILAGKLLKEKPVLASVYGEEDLNEVSRALEEQGIETAGICKVEEEPETAVLLVVKAGVHNGKQIEKVLDFCKKCEITVQAALLWDADEKLIRAYEMPEHVLRASMKKVETK